jgi:hypothetical protein
MRDMTGRARSATRFAAIGVGVSVALGLIVGPSLGADPTPTPKVPPGQADKSPKPQKSKAPETPITVSGTVTATKDDDGRTTYSVTSGGKTYELGAGPGWWWGDDHPLAAYAGKAVTIAGSLEEGTTEIDVETVGGKAVKTWTGKPPWAGGPKVVGEKHPGWKSWSAAHPGGKPGRGPAFGKATAPGQLKKAQREAAAASASPAP